MGASATTSLTGLMVSIGVFSVSFYAVVENVTQQEMPNDRIEAAELAARAASLVDQILGTAGVNWYEQGACAEGLPSDALHPEDVARFGLAEEACPDAHLKGAPNALGYHKVKALREAAIQSIINNGKVDYEEAFESLELAEAELDFHIDAYPIIPSIEEALKEGKKEFLVRPLYIADFEESGGTGSQWGFTPFPQVDALIHILLQEAIAQSQENGEGSPVGDAGDSLEETFYGGGETTYDIQPWAIIESYYLDSLVAQFDYAVPDEEYETESIEHGVDGDVAPDAKDFLKDWLPSVLLDDDGNPRYDVYNVIIVGSRVSDDQLNDGKVRNAISDWVRDGGFLVQLGSPYEIKWLRPFTKAHLDMESNAPDKFDADHALAKFPHDLDLVDYLTQEMSWAYDGENNGALWQHVVAAGSNDLLSLSIEDAFGEGRIVLSAYEPFQLTTSEQPECNGVPP